MEKENLEQLKNEAKPDNSLPEKNQGGEKKKSFFSKKKLVIAVLAALIIAAGVYFGPKIFKPEPKELYSVAVVVRSQSHPDPEEDRQGSLKAGDVLTVQKGEHTWSRTEKISYLVLRMNLTEEQRSKITSPKERVLEMDELPPEEQDMIAEQKRMAQEQGEEYMEEPRTETLIAREYYIDLLKHFPDFEPNDLLRGQPYLDEVYDWGVVSKKK